MATPIWTIKPDQLHAAQLSGDRPVLRDVRTAAEYRAGHMPGAELLPVGELRPDEVTRRFKHAAPGHQEPIYISCQSRARARQTAERLQLAGFTNLPEETFVYPAHDYNGMTVSTIGEEKRHNKRLQVSGKQVYIVQMNVLVLDDPRLMDIAVPASRACGVLDAA